MQPNYRVTCLIDGMALYPVVLDPDSAPWFCAGCRHSWWAAELSEEARKMFRKKSEDFGFGEDTWAFQDRVRVEHESARARGTSVRPDMLELIPVEGFKRLVNDTKINVNFRKLIFEEAARKGEKH